jgi:hypothetical protein
VPREQFAQCRIVAAGQGRDQLIVVHHLIYCTHGSGGSRLSVNFPVGGLALRAEPGRFTMGQC